MSRTHTIYQANAAHSPEHQGELRRRSGLMRYFPAIDAGLAGKLVFAAVCIFTTIFVVIVIVIMALV